VGGRAAARAIREDNAGGRRELWDNEGFRSGQQGQRMGRWDDMGGLFFMIKKKIIIKELSTDGLLRIPYPLATACREGLTTLS